MNHSRRHLFGLLLQIGFVRPVKSTFQFFLGFVMKFMTFWIFCKDSIFVVNPCHSYIFPPCFDFSEDVLVNGSSVLLLPCNFLSILGKLLGIQASKRFLLLIVQLGFSKSWVNMLLVYSCWGLALFAVLNQGRFQLHYPIRDVGFL